MTILFQRGVGKSDDYVLFKKGDKYWSGNEGLDLNHDEQVTKSEAATRVRAIYEKGLKGL